MDTALISQKVETAFNNFEKSIGKHRDINQKRADGGWSVGEIGDHILKGTQADFGPTQKTERAYDQHADSIKETFLNFNLKFPAAPFLQPDEKEYTKPELLDALEHNKNALLNMIRREDLTETCVEVELPVWGRLTKYEWLVLIENHLVRHTRQVNDFNTVGKEPQA